MKRVGNLYSKICDIENIRLAHRNARKGKTFYKEVKMVDADEDKYCNNIADMLRTHNFVNSEYIEFTKIDKGKSRVIHKLPYYPDRIVHHAMMQVLEPIWKTVLIADTFQSIVGRGVHKGKSRIEPVIRSGNVNYCLKLDIKKFYPSINNEILKSIVRRKIKCSETLRLLDVVIDSIKGLPIGNYLSQYLGNLYLTYFDHYVKEELKVEYYYRYCDDMVMLSSSKKYLHSVLASIRRYLEDSLNLTIKGDYQVFPISRGVDFLGFRFFSKYTLIRKSIATNLKRASRKLIKFPNSKTISGFVSYYGWTVTGDGRNLWKYSISPSMVVAVSSVGIKNKTIRMCV